MSIIAVCISIRYIWSPTKWLGPVWMYTCWLHKDRIVQLCPYCALITYHSISLTVADYILLNCIHYIIIHTVTCQWLLSITSIANKQASVINLYTISNCNNNDFYQYDTCTMHRNIINTRTIYDYHTVSNTRVYCLVNKANTTVFRTKLFPLTVDT